MAFPGTAFVMQREIKQSKNDLIDFVLIIFHSFTRERCYRGYYDVPHFFVRAPLRCARAFGRAGCVAPYGARHVSKPFPSAYALGSIILPLRGLRSFVSSFLLFVPSFYVYPLI